MKNLKTSVIATCLASLSIFSSCKKDSSFASDVSQKVVAQEQKKEELIDKLTGRAYTLTLLVDRSTGKSVIDQSLDFPFQIQDDRFVLKPGAVVSWDFGKTLIEDRAINSDANWGLNAQADSISIGGIDEESFKKKANPRQIHKKYKIEAMDELNLKLSTTINGVIIDRIYKHSKI